MLIQPYKSNSISFFFIKKTNNNILYTFKKLNELLSHFYPRIECYYLFLLYVSLKKALLLIIIIFYSNLIIYHIELISKRKQSALSSRLFQ